MRKLLSVLAVAYLAGTAHAEEPGWPEVLLVPVECATYSAVPGGHESPVTWDYVVSFASCIQDDTIPAVRTLRDIDDLPQRLQIALAPSVHFFVATVEDGPRASKLRAAYYIALGQLTLVTRARASITSEDVALRARLEPLLAPHARTAWEYFSMLGSVGKNDAVLANDPVVQAMTRSSRRYAAALDHAWHFSAALSATE